MGPEWDRVFIALMEAFGAASDETWLVGGCLRDALLGLPVGDLDLVTAADPLEIAQRLHAQLGASVARLPRSVRAGIPAESLESGSPACQVDISALGEGSVEDDLRARDFTINAMAMPLRAWHTLREASQHGSVPPSDLLDPTGGYADLQRGLLRLAGHEALRDDSGRILRGARLIARLGLTPTDETIALATYAGPLLRDLSPDRLRDELNLLLAEPGCAEGMAFLARTGSLTIVFPELTEPRTVVHALDCLRWTARIQRDAESDVHDGFDRESSMGRWYASPLSNGAPRITALRWGLLLHALAPHEESGLPGPRVERGSDASVLRRLPRGPERRIAFEIEARASFTARFLAYREPDERDMRRLFAVAGEVTVDVLVAAVACASAQQAEGTMRADDARLAGERVAAILDLYFADPARLIPPPLLTGGDLIQGLGVAPGPMVHRLLAEVREAQLDGRVTSRAEALALAAEALGEQAL